MARSRGAGARRARSQTRLPLALATLATGALTAGLVRRRGIPRLASPYLYRLSRSRSQRRDTPEDSRLYGSRNRRLEAHLARLPNGRRAVLAVPVDGSARAAVYEVGERRPWEEFERRAGLAGSRWGPCRSASAGL